MVYFKKPTLEKIFQEAKVIIFDLNGLIVDDERFKLQAFNQVFKNFNIRISKHYWINQCIGYTELNNFKKIFNLKKISKTNLELRQIIQKQHNFYEKLVVTCIKKIVRPGVLKLIKYIKKYTNKKLALATSTNEHGYKLILGKKGLNILKQFDFIVCGEEIRNSKPHPEIYLKVKKHFKAKANDYLVFEDAATGVRAAKNVKMKCFAIPSKYTFNQDFALADFIISDLSKEAKIIF